MNAMFFYHLVNLCWEPKNGCCSYFEVLTSTRLYLHTKKDVPKINDRVTNVGGAFNDSPALLISNI